MISKIFSAPENALGWWSLKLAIFCLGLNYVLGGAAVFCFALGWWWGIRGESAAGD